MVFFYILFLLIAPFYFGRFAFKRFSETKYTKAIRILGGISSGFLAFLLLFIIGALLFIDDEIENDLSIKTDIHYTIFSKNDFSFNGRERLRFVIIAPSAFSKIQRAIVVKKAAIDLQVKTNADLIDVWLAADEKIANLSYQLATASYTPDGCGNSGEDCDGNQFEIKVTDKIFTDLEISVLLDWYKYRDDFNQSSVFDEAGLKSYIAEKNKTTVENVGLPFIYLELFENQEQ